MLKRRLLVIGGGMAAARFVDELCIKAEDRFSISMICGEPWAPYNRIQLSRFISQGGDPTQLLLYSPEWYAERDVTLHVGDPAVQVDFVRRVVYTERGEAFYYDDLVFATGSHPICLDVPGRDLDGVFTFRTYADCAEIRAYARGARKAAVIGGGLLGLEAARGLLDLGLEVVVVHLMDRLMERQLDNRAAVLLREELEGQGVRFLMPKETVAFLGDGHVERIAFSDGENLDIDFVVQSIGIRPNVDLARAAGIQVRRGIVVDDGLHTSAPNVYAIGECVEHRGVVYGLVSPLYEQARVLAERLAGNEAQYRGSLVYTKLKVSGVDLFSAGRVEGPGLSSFVVEDERRRVYQKLVFGENGEIQGAILYGDVEASSRIVAAMASGASISASPLQWLAGGRPVLTISDDSEIVCTCNGVSRREITQAIVAHGLTTVKAVRQATRAASTCGGCKARIEKIIAEVRGKKEPICSCTELSRDEVVAFLKSGRYLTVLDAMRALGWKTEEGCPKCRPALNYYLNMLFPKAHRDEPVSRLVNEREHANIQKDGTFSVVPRMYGGVTSPADLRRIAEVAEKYQVKMVKITGGQRIDLLGVHKEDLPKIWADLGMSSGFAYAKAIRTVKTCVGSEFCRFGVQDSTTLGIRIEKKFERLNTPGKVKMAVSGCARNCAECSIKDVGVVAVEDGWEIFVGGNGGLKLRGADFLCKVATDDEALDWIGAFLQFYREEAEYGERTSHFVERVGIERIRHHLSDSAVRRELNERLEEALSVLEDPWEARIRELSSTTTNLT
ncbi:nitrite reductase large subunit NirB [Alicyclobacillus mali (ex Roth et al. 2021)]|uniref:nitrite reductase large subunit NirB n=1 Tax=Alicyclobacillus mali (ex Roth et al. 2021) TaxID=1123961 RepID=UPI001A8CC3A7|nr:nitrite reductase large subunit NirB [Alicyclobacillus mali (ex Roth et al. 2021)]MCL6488983.1 nitrite reductase large subunit NirB [Alicyclobacillus mali (ex Roth et al. 2021)]